MRFHVAFFSLVFACSEPDVTYHRDIAPLFADRCVGCHTDGAVAPMALDSYEAVEKWRELIAVQVKRRTMPPWLASAECNTYARDLSLSDAEIDMVLRWVELGGPEGDESDAPLPAAPEGLVDPTSIAELNVAIPMAEPYVPVEGTDDYRCFPAPWTEATTKYVVGLNVTPGNARLVHHVIVYADAPDELVTYEAMDAADAGPGYSCFGSSGTEARPLGSWVPGSAGPTVFPAGTGIALQPGAVIIMQVHYNTMEHVGEDQTTLELAVVGEVEKQGAALMFTNPDWLYGTMPIPAGVADVKHVFEIDVTRYYDFVLAGASPFPNNTPVLIHSAQLHMHLLGTRARLSLVRGGGQGEACLLDIPRWDFHWQSSYWLGEPLAMSPGDRLRIECHWDNSRSNQRVVDGRHEEPTDRNWGEGTGDEMCLGGMYVTEL